MVSAGVHRNGSHFHISTNPCPHLDGRAVAFARVVEGMEVVQKVRESRGACMAGGGECMHTYTCILGGKGHVCIYTYICMGREGLFVYMHVCHPCLFRVDLQW